MFPRFDLLTLSFDQLFAILGRNLTESPNLTDNEGLIEAGRNYFIENSSRLIQIIKLDQSYLHLVETSDLSEGTLFPPICRILDEKNILKDCGGDDTPRLALAAALTRYLVTPATTQPGNA
jgi:hypothetical protein